MSINIRHVEDTSKELRRVLRSHTIRSIFYTVNTFRKVLYKVKYRVTADNKNNFVFQIDCVNFELVYFGESKWYLKLMRF